MDIQEQAKIIRREGVILSRFDKEKEDGLVTGLFIVWQGNEWFIRMKNGVVTMVLALIIISNVRE